MQRKGFTLVELSIVLVIIGLLVGGILVAQSMINTARLTSTVKQLQQYDIAVGNFKTTYNCLPGDCAIIGPPGNNDGLIQEGTNQDDHFTGEIAAYWNILSSLQLVKDKVVYSTDATSGIRAGVNVPKLPIGENSGVMVVCEWEDGSARVGFDLQDYADWAGKHNYYQIFSTAGTTGDSMMTGVSGLDYSLSAPEALALDSKMDDGNAIKGNVRVAAAEEHKVIFAGAVTYNQAAGSGCVLPADNSMYNVASTSKYPCALMIPLLAQVGQN